MHSGHGGWSSVHRCVSGGASQNMCARASSLQFLASAAIGRGAGSQGSRFNVYLLLRHPVSTLSSGAVSLSQHLLLELLRHMCLNTRFDRLNTCLTVSHLRFARSDKIESYVFRYFRRLQCLRLQVCRPLQLITLLLGFKMT